MKVINTVLLLLISLFITSCAIHRMSRTDFPKALHTLQYQPANPHDPLAVQLKRTLQSSGIQLVSHGSTRTPILKLSPSKYGSTLPERFNSNVANNYDYSLSVKVVLTYPNKSPFLISTFTANESILHNANQTYTSGQYTELLPQLVDNLNSQILVAIATANPKERVKEKEALDAWDE